ncbi:MAG TPA: hypothetical protein P5140_07680 [Methanofastidiosum sp.]|nr:hypothetical protein [Methanofastidiosum sp.]
MLYNKIDSEKYIAEFGSRFANLAQRAPILMSFVVAQDGVTVIHENSGTKYFFEWDFTLPVKVFIYNIKAKISENHYPRLGKVTSEEIPLSQEERVALIEQGTPVEEVPKTKVITKTTVYRIDKVIALKDIFIIYDEATKKMYRYRLHYSSIFFLKNYRSGKYKSIEEAGEFFFSKAEFLNELP